MYRNDKPNGHKSGDYCQNQIFYKEILMMQKYCFYLKYSRTINDNRFGGKGFWIEVIFALKL